MANAAAVVTDDYPTFIAEGLPIGSGEVEGRIRHIVRRRLDVPGDWREENLVLLTALLTIRHSGWWNDFWRRHEENTGDSRSEAMAKLRRLLGRDYMTRPVCDLYLRDLLRR